METANITSVSIIIPVYYNQDVILVTMDVIYKTVILQHPNVQWEVILVDDGSGDQSYEQLLQIHETYPHIIKVVKLTRNFGQVSAIIAGISIASGNCMVVLSADNQDPADLIHEMLAAHIDEKYPIVVATRAERDESIFRIWTSQIFYRLIKKMSFSNMPIGGFDFVLLERRVVEVLLRNREATPFFQGQILWTGFRTKFIGYTRRKREIGESRWTLRKKITYLIDGIMGYSFLPIRIMSIIGFIVAFLGFGYAILIITLKIFWNLPIEGWAPIMVSILTIGGLQILMLGVIGEYLWRVLAQVRNRDLYVIESVRSESPVTMPREILVASEDKDLRL